MRFSANPEMNHGISLIWMIYLHIHLCFCAVVCHVYWLYRLKKKNWVKTFETKVASLVDQPDRRQGFNLLCTVFPQARELCRLRQVWRFYKAQGANRRTENLSPPDVRLPENDEKKFNFTMLFFIYLSVWKLAIQYHVTIINQLNEWM